VRARAEIETSKRGERIVVTEIPFMVNKASMQERIAELAREGKIDGVADLRDESNREGMRIVIELKKDAPAEVVLNQLYKQTPMQSTFGVNLLALVNGRPQTLSLKEALRTSSTSGARWWCAAPPTTSPRPRRAPTCSRASSSRSTTSTR
jgi:DNA gyrase subunit A